MGIENLKKALKNKDDEFYTAYEDIEKEISLYEDKLRGKRILCPTDTKESNFWKYLNDNFERLQLKCLMASHIKEKTYIARQGNLTAYDIPFRENGDFFNDEVQEILSTFDVVITNPPFSLCRDFVSCLIRKNKDFILLAPETAVASRDLFPYFKEEKFFYGKNKVKTFYRPDGNTKDFGNIGWITSFRNDFTPPLLLSKTFNDLKEKQFYDNYEALNIDKVADIPNDYFGVMGVPITYLRKHDSNLFSILGFAKSSVKNDKLYGDVVYKEGTEDHGGSPMLNGKEKYTRVFIKRKEE